MRLHSRCFVLTLISHFFILSANLSHKKHGIKDNLLFPILSLSSEFPRPRHTFDSIGGPIIFRQGPAPVRALNSLTHNTSHSSSSKELCRNFICTNSVLSCLPFESCTLCQILLPSKYRRTVRNCSWLNYSGATKVRSLSFHVSSHHCLCIHRTSWPPSLSETTNMPHELYPKPCVNTDRRTSVYRDSS